jgi:hypothetical protein
LHVPEAYGPPATTIDVWAAGDHRPARCGRMPCAVQSSTGRRPRWRSHSGSAAGKRRRPDTIMGISSDPTVATDAAHAADTSDAAARLTIQAPARIKRGGSRRLVLVHTESDRWRAWLTACVGKQVLGVDDRQPIGMGRRTSTMPRRDRVGRRQRLWQVGQGLRRGGAGCARVRPRAGGRDRRTARSRSRVAVRCRPPRRAVGVGAGADRAPRWLMLTPGVRRAAG